MIKSFKQAERKKTFSHLSEDLFGYDDLKCETRPDGRKYVDPDGKAYPSVTTVLSILSEEAIFKWKQRVGQEEANAVSRRASTRGTAVHKIIEDYIDNVEDFCGKHMPHIIEAFTKVQPVLDERIGEIYCQEKALYSRYLGIAGRVDCIGKFDGKLSIIDFKTSSKPKEKDMIENYFIQETAYAIMFEERTGIPITQLVTIIAVDDNPEPQVFIEHRDNWDKKLINTIKDYKLLKG